MPYKILYYSNNYNPLTLFHIKVNNKCCNRGSDFIRFLPFSLNHYLWMKYSNMFSLTILILSWHFHEYSYWIAVIMLGITGCWFYDLQCWRELAQRGRKWVRCNCNTFERFATLSSKQWIKGNFSKSIQSFSLEKCISSLVIFKRHLGIEYCLIIFFLYKSSDE